MPPQLPYMRPDIGKLESAIPSPSKIATCCYCGTRAALVLKGKQRHELSCSSCGAPLHDLKMVPKRKLVDHKGSRVSGRAQMNRKKKKKSLFSRVLDEAWDVIEDVFD